MRRVSSPAFSATNPFVRLTVHSGTPNRLTVAWGELEMTFGEGDLAVSIDGRAVNLPFAEDRCDHRFRQIAEKDGLEWERMICPAADLPLVILRLTVRNRRDQPVIVTWTAPTTRWEVGGLRIHQSWGPDGEATIRPGDEFSIWGEIAAWSGVEKIPIAMPDEERRWGEVAR